MKPKPPRKQSGIYVDVKKAFQALARRKPSVYGGFRHRRRARLIPQ